MTSDFASCSPSLWQLLVLGLNEKHCVQTAAFQDMRQQVKLLKSWHRCSSSTKSSSFPVMNCLFPSQSCHEANTKLASVCLHFFFRSGKCKFDKFHLSEFSHSSYNWTNHALDTLTTLFFKREKMHLLKKQLKKGVKHKYPELTEVIQQTHLPKRKRKKKVCNK